MEASLVCTGDTVPVAVTLSRASPTFKFKSSRAFWLTVSARVAEMVARKPGFMAVTV